MTKERRIRLMWRWSLLTAGLIALFWAIWYLITGSVPAVRAVKMTPTWTLELPFSVSRWWDILVGPIWFAILIFFLTSERIRKYEDWVSGLVSGLVFGLGFGLVFGLVSGLVFGLVSGLVFGLGFGLVSGLVFGLVFGLVAVLKFLFSQTLWQRISNWLLARGESKET